jgi:hypothetical protein
MVKLTRTYRFYLYIVKWYTAAIIKNIGAEVNMTLTREPLIYDIPSARYNGTKLQELARLIAGIMFSHVYGAEQVFKWELEEENSIRIRINCTYTQSKVKWVCTLRIYSDIFIPEYCEFQPVEGKDKTKLGLVKVKKQNDVYYYQVINHTRDVLNTIGLRCI